MEVAAETPPENNINPESAQDYLIEEVAYYGSKQTYLDLKIDLSTQFMAAMLSNPEVYSTKHLDEKYEDQTRLENYLIETAHELAEKMIDYCISFDEDMEDDENIENNE